MINLYRKIIRSPGAATFLFTIILLLLSTLIIIFAANFGQLQNKTAANLTRNNQAIYAAEAGLEYAINYLQKNSAAIVASASGGFINYSNASTTNVTLANNSKFTAVYTNPQSSNYKLIKITSTGTSEDGTATRIVSQLVQFGSMLQTAPSIPITAKDNVSLSGSAQVTNTLSNTTIKSSDNVSLNNSAQTVLNSGVSSTASNILSDIQENLASLDNTSSSDLFATYFGLPTSTVKTNVANYYSNSINTNYSSTLNGKTGTSIWIDQTGGSATINGFTVIGSNANPVLLITNGNLILGGVVIIYGMVYVIGTVNTSSFNFVTVNGSLIATGTINLINNAQLTYSSSILTNLQNQSSMLYYAKVPGSWRDF